MSDSLTQTPPPVPSQSHAAPSAQAVRRPRRRWVLRIVLGLFALALVGLWFAPTIIAKTALRDRIARKLGDGLNGTVTIGGASLSWFSPVELRDVTVTDSQGRVVARIPKVTSAKSLLSLLWNRSDPGEFTLDRPTVDVVRESDSTNIEDLLKRESKPSAAPPSPTRTPVAVRVIDGTITIRDAETGRSGEFTQLDATVRIPAARTEPIAIAVSAAAPGRVELEASLGETNRVKLTAEGLALESLAPLFRRAGPGLTLAGSLTADVTATWAPSTATVVGKLGVRNLALSAPWLEGDTLRLASAELPLSVSMTGRAVRIQQAELTSDLGTVSLSGEFDPTEPLEKLLDRPGMKLDATLDVAKVAATLPKLLQVRDGTTIREGNLVVKLGSAATPTGTAWTGEVRTSALKATRDGRDIVWDSPLTLDFAGRFKPGHLPTFEQLTCQSEFLSVNAEVKAELIRGAANLHLDKLRERLAEFIDLGGVTLDGRGSAWVVIRRTPEGGFKADANLELKQFAFTDRTGKGFREPALNLRASAAGVATSTDPISVSAASLDLTAGIDELRLTLLEPIPDVKNLTAGKLDARLTGELARWRTRAAAAVRIPKHYVMGGTATATGTIRFAPGSIAIDKLTLTLDKARFRGAGLDLDEPRMHAVADLTIEPGTGTTTFANFTITSAPLSVTNGRMVIKTPENGELVVQGSGPATTDLNRLGKTLKLYADPRGPEALHGKAVGSIRFKYSGDVTTFGGALDVTDFATGLKSDPDWAEPRLLLETEGSYTQSTDTVTLTTAKVERPGLSLTGAGTLGKFDTTTDAKLDGTLTYDMSKLTPKLRNLLGGGFTAEGKGTKPFSLAGSFTPQAKTGAKGPPSMLSALTAEVALGWNSLHAYGFDVGTGELKVKLADGLARFTPISATFGGGKVNVRPTLRLAPEPGEAFFAQGVIVEKAKLSPAVCANALGYALPAIARTGKAEGEVSITLQENHVPFADIEKATVKGQITIHKATVSGGPFVGEVAKLLGADAATMTLANEQVVPVRVEKGRVHHQNLSLKFGGYTVTTSGSVGFDGTLDLVADVPIPGGLPGLKSTPQLAKALTGKRVQIPIKGTLSAPALDPKLFQNAVAKLAADTAKELVKDIGKDVLNKELEKLFPKK